MIAWLDAMGHRLRLPSSIGPIPLMRIVCDRFELSLGITPEQIMPDYGGRRPWWLGKERDGEAEAKPTHVVCTECGLPWDDHMKDRKTEPTADVCIRLLKAELAKRPRMQTIYNATSAGSGLG